MDYDAAPIRAHWDYTRASYGAFFWFHLTRARPYALPIYIGVPIVAVCVVYGADLFSPLVAATYGIVLYALIALSLARSLRRNLRQLSRLRPNGIDYAFRNGEIVADAPGGASSLNGTYKYALIAKAFETETAFYLYLPGGNALTVEKRSMAEGAPAELAELLKSRIGPQKVIRTKYAAGSIGAQASKPSYVEEHETQAYAAEAAPPSYVAEEQARKQYAQSEDVFAYCDQAPIRVHSQYDFASYRRFQLFHSFARKRTYPAVLAVLVLLIVLEAAVFEDRLLALGSVLVLVVFLMPVLSVLFRIRRAHAAQSRLTPDGAEFTFYSNAFTSVNRSEAATGESSTPYAMLDHVYETKHAFYLYQMAGRAYPVEKRSVADGRVAELAALLRAKVGQKKYKRR